jgi:hypothetical protein
MSASRTSKTRMWRSAAVLLMAVALAGGILVRTSGTAHADYGNGAVYQVEISDNCVGPGTCIPGVIKGFGIWFWAELDANGTGDYEAADCGHFGPGNVPGVTGAFHDGGDVTWHFTGNGTIEIDGAAIFGNTVPMTIVIPAQFGHVVMATSDVITVAGFPPLPGVAQIQVAP